MPNELTTPTRGIAAYACDQHAQGIKGCTRWCGDAAKCIASQAEPVKGRLAKPLPEYEAEPHRHLTHAIRHLLSCYDRGQQDAEVRRLTQPLVALRDRLHAEAQGTPDSPR